jgi:hypothetical protein
MITEVKIEEIQDIYHKKNSYEKLIPFIGAGFSACIIPDWNSIVSKLLESFDLSEKDLYDLSNSPLDAFEFYIWRSIQKEIMRFNTYTTREEKYQYGKDQLLKFIKDQVDVKVVKEGNNYFGLDKNGNKVSLRNHKKICEKFNDVIYTTNWDSLIEDVGGFISISQRKELLEGRNTEKNKRVIKFHGCARNYEIPRNDGIIASKTDYYRRMSEFNLFDLVFRNDFIQNKFLFVGYSLKDTNVSLMVYQLMKILSEFSHEYKLIWAVSEFRNDSRVFTICSHASIRPYYLLTKDQEEKLQLRENKIQEKCRQCKYSSFLSSNYNDYSLKFICIHECSINLDKEALKVERNNFIEERIHFLLNIL